MFVNNALCVLVTKNLLGRACIARVVLLSDLETGKVRRFSACQGHVSHRPHPTDRKGSCCAFYKVSTLFVRTKLLEVLS